MVSSGKEEKALAHSPSAKGQPLSAKEAKEKKKSNTIKLLNKSLVLGLNLSGS